MYQPLADLLRPRTLDDVYGQDHILAEGAILRRLIESGKIPNMVFYGPSGTGKTTVANIIADQTQRKLFKLNATTASTADIREIVAQLDTFMAPNGILLYLDEIQSFNKKQQQSLLEHIENGKITLIGDLIETQMKNQMTTGGLNVGAALSLALMVIILLCTFVLNRVDKDGEGSVMI